MFFKIFPRNVPLAYKKSPLLPKACEKFHFLPNTHKKSPISPKKHMKVSTSPKSVRKIPLSPKKKHKKVFFRKGMFA